MKYVKKEQPVDAEQYLKENENLPDGVMIDGFDPATNTWDQLTVTMSNGQKMPVNETDWVITNEHGDRFVYTNEQFELLFGEPAPVVADKAPERPCIEFKDGDKVVGVLEVKDGELTFIGPCKKLAQNLFNNTQKLVDSYIDEKIKSLTDKAVIERILKGIVPRYSIGQSSRGMCRCCNKKGKGQLLILRYSDHDKRRVHICDVCIAKLAVLVNNMENNNE